MKNYWIKSVINNETLPQMMWDEENRLKHVYDEEYTLSSYLYDAGGERTLKLWDGYQYMMINGQQQIGFFDITDYTLYSSPYMVLTPEQYTKHYYAESDRIVSKIGGGMANNIYPIPEIVTGFNIYDHGGYHQKSNQLMEMFDRDYNQLNVQADVNAHFEYWLNDAINQDEYEEMIFFYHKDHLGSSTQISDPGANIIQHIEYLPYGETFFEHRSYWNTPYKFNAKELDQETGLYYYGARYYTPEVSIWLSVDKKANRAPQESPYAYCGNNPIVFIDPDGNFKRKFWARVYKLFYGGEYYYDNDRNEYYVAKPHNRKGNNNTTVDFGNNSTTLDPIEIGHDNKRAYNFKFFKGGLFYTKDSDDGLPQNQGPAIESDGDPQITDGDMMPGSNFGLHSGLKPRQYAEWIYGISKGIIKVAEMVNDLIISHSKSSGDEDVNGKTSVVIENRNMKTRFEKDSVNIEYNPVNGEKIILRYECDKNKTPITDKEAREIKN